MREGLLPFPTGPYTGNQRGKLWGGEVVESTPHAFPSRMLKCSLMSLPWLPELLDNFCIQEYNAKLPSK